MNFIWIYGGGHGKGGAYMSPSMVNVSGVPAAVAPVIQGLAGDIGAALGAGLESITITGSVLTPDFIPGLSDINSVLVVREMAQPLLDALSGLGKRYGKKQVRAPIILTGRYLERSLDVFPIEFLEMKLIHQTIYGPDRFADLPIDRAMLRVQCERELKGKIVTLSRGYIAAAGQKDALLALVMGASSGFYPLLRAMLYLAGMDPPRDRASVLRAVEAQHGVALDGLKEVQTLRSQKRPKIAQVELQSLFQQVYGLTHALSLIVDEITV